MKRLLAAFFFSAQGLLVAWREEMAFRQEVLGSLFLIPLAIYWAPDRVSLILMLGSWGLVLITELLNSAIEATVDRIGPEMHPLSKKAKDLGSAAVLGALLLSGVIWLAILI